MLNNTFVQLDRITRFLSFFFQLQPVPRIQRGKRKQHSVCVHSVRQSTRRQFWRPMSPIFKILSVKWLNLSPCIASSSERGNHNILPPIKDRTHNRRVYNQIYQFYLRSNNSLIQLETCCFCVYISKLRIYKYLRSCRLNLYVILSLRDSVSY